MPAVPRLRAIATKDSVANLFAMAETDGEVIIRVDSENACLRIRNQLYKHRTGLRKQSHNLLGIEASHLDGFKFSFWREVAPTLENPYELVPTGKWSLRIAYDVQIEFELLLPDDYDLDTLPHFDTINDDEFVTQMETSHDHD